MDRDSMKRLRLDQRLIRRRGWISGEELERELADLPDVSHKVAPQDDEGSEADAPSPAAAPQPAGGGSELQ